MSLIVPPCIKKAVSAKDEDAVDEIFSYLHSYADDATRDAVLWSIGYYDLANYQQRKLTAEAQIRSAPFFICSPFEKPEHLSKYCTPDDEATCPLRDPAKKLELLVYAVYFYHEAGRPFATLEVHLRDGTVFRRVNGSYGLNNSWPFWEVSAERFLDWYSKTHRGRYPDVIPLDVDEVAQFLMSKAVRLEVSADAPAVRGSDVV